MWVWCIRSKTTSTFTVVQVPNLHQPGINSTFVVEQVINLLHRRGGLLFLFRQVELLLPAKHSRKNRKLPHFLYFSSHTAERAHRRNFAPVREGEKLPFQGTKIII
jgi:hypothetical protein